MKSQPVFIRQMQALVGAGVALAAVALALALWLDWAWAPVLSVLAMLLSASGLVWGVYVGRRQGRAS